MITVRALAEYEDLDAALDRYHAVDSACFGERSDPGAFAEKRPMIDADRWFVAEVDGQPCGGSGSFPTELTLPGGATLPTAAVSDVGVLPTHRRRGALSALMRRQLHDCVDRGDAAAVLHASEGAIYRRFGYGPTTRWRQVRVDARRVRFRSDLPVAEGSLRLVAKEDALDACRGVHDRVRLMRPGGLARSDAWWQVVLGGSGLYLGGNPKHLVVLHEDDAGRPDGYAIYEVHGDWSRGQAHHTLEVWELVGETPAVEIALWRTMITHDLVATVVGPIAVDHVLWDVVEDGRQVGVAWEQDLLWLRPLDIERLLSSRTYAADGELVLEVHDPVLDGTGGRFRLETSGAESQCARTDAAPDLVLDVADLGSVALGGGSFRRLGRAGRVEERRAGAAGLADRLFAVDPLPWCWVRF